MQEEPCKPNAMRLMRLNTTEVVEGERALWPVFRSGEEGAKN
jgi:hypothetical protein